MTPETKTTRVTKVRLSQNELMEAIKIYLKSKDVIDTEHHVVIKIIENVGVLCETEMEVTLTNYKL